MSEYIVDGAEPNNTVLQTRSRNGYELEKWLPVREEIVRCRDCRMFGDCEWNYENEPMGFCSWGYVLKEGGDA